MTRLRPPRPFPPHDGDPEGIIDLGVRLRDTLFRRAHMQRVVRAGLAKRLDEATDQQNWAHAAELLQAFLDTWPIAASIDGARRAWTAGPAPAALTVLHRASTLTALSTGTAIGWPVPTHNWSKRTVGNRILTGVEQRCPQDGATELAELWDVPVVPADLSDVPDVVRPLLHGDATHLNEAEQAAVARFGVYGAEVPDAPLWTDVLAPPPPGVFGHVLTPLATVIEAPSTPARLKKGQLRATAWLVWDGPHKPMPITSPAAAVLSRMDGALPTVQIAELLAAPAHAVEEIARLLTTMGACSATS
ncbi:MAG: hypothetical protein AB8H79_06320 [Myxococcota bacterium]